MKKNLKQIFGFTLIELLIVIAVMAILTTVVFVALNPMARFQDSRNARRWADVNAMMSAIKLHQIDNNGVYLVEINDLTEDLVYQIGLGNDCNTACLGMTLQSACVEIEGLSDLGYIAGIPFDPSTSNVDNEKTRYYLIKRSEGTITIGACDEEMGSGSILPVISVTR